MKHLLITAAFVVSLVTVPTHADPSQDNVQEDLSGPHGHSGMIYDYEGMQQHLEQMQEMRELLQRVRSAEDPTERARLVAQHQEMMEKRMAVIMSGNKAEMLSRCHQQMTMMHDLMWEMAAQMEIMTAPGGVEEHYWGSPVPDE